MNKNIVPAVTQGSYGDLLDEIESIVVEKTYNATQEILEGKYQLGELIFNRSDAESVTLLIECVSRDTRLTKSDIWASLKFYREYDKIKELPEFQSKNISWNKTKRLLSGKKETKSEDGITFKFSERDGKYDVTLKCLGISLEEFDKIRKFIEDELHPYE